MTSKPFQPGFSPTRKLWIMILVALVGIFAGMMGFMFIEDMDPLGALYMTVITLSTVGFREVAPLSAGGRVFVMFLIVFGVLTAGAAVTFISEMILEGHFKHIVTRRKMQSKLTKMSGHFIVAGFGRVGAQVSREFMNRKVPFVVIEKDEANIERLLKDNVIPIKGDATDDDVLLAAGIERANTLISTLPDEALNVYLTMTARFMNPGLHIIARADFEGGEKKLMRAGANHVVIPHVLGGIRMAKAALQPNVVDFMQMATMGKEGLLVEELILPEKTKLAGQSLAESKLKQTYGISIIGVKQRGKSMDINPSSSTVLQAHDVLVVIGQTEALERLNRDVGE